METDLDLLGLEPGASAADIRTTWQRLASTHHPDKGGNAETFNQLRQAYKRAYAKAQQPSTCHHCGGSGKVTTSNGFNTIQARCRVCKGKGEI